VRIPLDYYRILGLPIQATADQLRQAHRDRTLQLPRREYSDAAIASRKRLLDEAYALLSDSERRQAYDAGFLAKTYELPDTTPPKFTSGDAKLEEGRDRTPTQMPTGGVDPDSYTPSIEIPDDQLVGALLLLQELGEYELVLKLGRPFLTGGNASLRGGQFGDPNIVYSDIVLTVALACLELGREQWQQGQYENAAEALETGEKLLLREGLFASVRGEIQADLDKLRPYRVLELLALPENNSTERYKGMQLLQDMLQERDGIDGTGNDQSGLNIDDFLRFIQQLRGYLTASEQQLLFEEEARRPSAVATYLAIYALLARGFAEHQPALVRRAKVFLSHLSSRQDVYLEQSVCALLLGQTEEASHALELSQEYAPIAFIREHSKGSPDLLPGLCLYAERWLQDEVFPHFRDLVGQRASLKQYFADEQVQGYLEELSTEAEPAPEWTAPAKSSSVYAAASVGVAARSERPSEGERYAGAGVATSSGYSQVGAGKQPSVSARVGEASPQAIPSLQENRESVDALLDAARQTTSRTATSTMLSGSGRVTGGSSTVTAAERVAQVTADSPPARTGDRPRRGKRQRGGEGLSPGEASPARTGRASISPNPALFRVLLPIGVLLGMVALGFLIAWLLRSWQSSSKPAIQVEQPLVSLDRPLVVLPSPDPTAIDGPLTNDSGRQIIAAWLAAKSAAMGSEHKVEELEKILVEPKLSEWQAASQDAKRDNWYKQYKHELKVLSVEQNQTNPDEAKVTAEVSEAEEYYEAGTLKDSRNDPALQVRYSLIRQNNQWKIQNWEIL
jgi:hypothetical protein